MSTSNHTTSSRSDRRVRAARAVAFVGVVGVVAAVAAGATGWARSGSSEFEPVVRIRQRVPEAVELEVRETVAEFVAVFDARRGCIGGAELLLVGEVDGGDARYDAAENLIEIAIPTSPGRFRESLVHELAHHVDSSCADAAVLRTDVMATVGATDWAGQERWEDRPSELWAESVVQIVLGERVRFERSVRLDPAVVDAARRWIVGPKG
jgi:hypothetical protein